MKGAFFMQKYCGNTTMIRQRDDKTLAMAYVPWQEWRMILDASTALQCGTIFKELDKPFACAGRCRR